MMTPEEQERYDRIDRQLEFIAQVTAQNTTRIAALEDVTTRMGEAVVSVGNAVVELAQHAARTEERFQQTEMRFQQTEAQIQELRAVMERLAESQTRTDQRLDALISVVERYFSNGRQ